VTSGQAKCGFRAPLPTSWYRPGRVVNISWVALLGWCSLGVILSLSARSRTYSQEFYFRTMGNRVLDFPQPGDDDDLSPSVVADAQNAGTDNTSEGSTAKGFSETWMAGGADSESAVSTGSPTVIWRSSRIASHQGEWIKDDVCLLFQQLLPRSRQDQRRSMAPCFRCQWALPFACSRPVYQSLCPTHQAGGTIGYSSALNNANAPT